MENCSSMSDTMNYFVLDKNWLFCWKKYFSPFVNQNANYRELRYQRCIFQICHIRLSALSILSDGKWKILICRTVRNVLFCEPKIFVRLKLKQSLGAKIHMKSKLFWFHLIFHQVFVKLAPCLWKSYVQELQNSRLKLFSCVLYTLYFHFIGKKDERKFLRHFFTFWLLKF